MTAPAVSRRVRLLITSAVLATLATACSGSTSDPVIVSETPTKPTGSMTVAPGSFLLDEGQVLPLKAKVGGASIAASQISWSVSPSSVATIDPNGVLSGLHHGEAIVTARYSNLTASSMGTVRAIPKVIQTFSTATPVGIVGRTLTDSVGILALSVDGVPVPGVDVTFELLSGGGSLSATSGTTGKDGVARFAWILGTGAGQQDMRAHSGPLGEVFIQAEALADYDSASVVPLAGDGQEAEVADLLPEPLRARVADQFDNPLPGLAVEWHFTDGGGANVSSSNPAITASVIPATTDADGFTEMQWRLGTEAGDQEARVVLAGAPEGASPNASGPQSGSDWWSSFWARWRAWARAGSATGARITPSEAWAILLEDEHLSATLIDQYGNDVSGGTFSWHSTDPQLLFLNGSGVVRGTKVGRTQVIAESSSPSFTTTAWVNVNTRVPSDLDCVDGDGQSAVVGTSLTKPLTIKVTDASGKAVAGKEVYWAVPSAFNEVSGPGPNASSSAGGTSNSMTVTDASGLAQTQWTLGSQAGSQTLHATVGDLPPMAFQAEALPGVVTQLTLAPTSAKINIGGIRDFSASALDAFGNLVTTGGATWTTSAPAIAQVSAPGKIIGRGEGQTTVTAEMGGVQGTATLTVQRGQPALLDVTDGQGQSGIVGENLGKELKATVLDQTGLPVSDAEVSWTPGEEFGSVSSSTSTTGPDGVATTSWTLGTGAGTQTLQLSMPGLDPVTFSAQGAPGLPSTLTVNPSTANMGEDQELTFSADVQDEYGNTIQDIEAEWNSSAPGVASVNASGLVTAAGPGEAQIFATVGETSNSATVTVTADAPPPPPPLASNSVDLAVTRLDGGQGPVLISNGIPLAMGTIMPGEVDNVRVMVNGVEQAVYVEALRGRHLDGSIRSLLVQFEYGVNAGSPVNGRLDWGPEVIRTHPDRGRYATRATPKAVALPTDPNYLVNTGITIHPVLTETQAHAELDGNAMGHALDVFRTESDAHWQAYGADYLKTSHIYDRALNHFTFWAMTGEVKYWERAVANTLVARAGSTDTPQTQGVAPRFYQPDGMALHYLLTGDEESIDYLVGGVVRMSLMAQHNPTNLAKFGIPPEGYSYNEGRIRARVLLGTLWAWILEDNQADWGTRADQIVEGMIQGQNPNGSLTWRLGTDNTAAQDLRYGQANFMEGLAMDAVIKYHILRNPDHRIVNYVQGMVEFMDNSEWSEADQAWHYWSPAAAYDIGDSKVSLGNADELNAMITIGHYWADHMNGSTRNRARADQAFGKTFSSSGANFGTIWGRKVFNQAFLTGLAQMYYRQR